MDSNVSEVLAQGLSLDQVVLTILMIVGIFALVFILGSIFLLIFKLIEKIIKKVTGKK